MIRIPPYLQKGDRIGIVSTASKIDREVVEPAVELLLSLGFKVELGVNIFNCTNQFAGTDEERALDLQEMLDRNEVKAIICSRGGYGTLRTLQNISWDKFNENPKWIIGFSDVTVLHSQLNSFRVASIHGVMLKYFADEGIATPSFGTLMKAITGEQIQYEIAASEFNKYGESEGELVGGNLSILYSLRGTSLDLDTQDKILFIEDLSEYLYHLDRIMMNLKVGGKLSAVKGLIVGGFTGMKDNETPFGKSVEEIILDSVKDFNFPVAFNFPAGHQSDNFAIKLGCMAKLKVDRNRVFFQQ